MWPFNHLPLEQIEKVHGVQIDSEFIERLRQASVRFNNGGSASFVSANGLVMTNHHVASDCIKKLSSKEKDYIQDGFYAEKASAEMKCPDLEVNVLMSIETVTDRINAKVTPDMTEKDRFEAQRAATAEVEKACKDETGLRCDIVKLYAGGIFDLYRYKRYTDVRLVFVPEFYAAFFGGDPDNFPIRAIAWMLRFCAFTRTKSRSSLRPTCRGARRAPRPMKWCSFPGIPAERTG